MERNLAILEEKVLAAVDLIKSLRADNAGLRTERDDLAVRLDDVTEENVDLKRELGQVRRSVTDTEQFEVKRRAIEEKVGGLLEMLEGIG
jgi:FtsZ-binding cell division protein ZapB